MRKAVRATSPMPPSQTEEPNVAGTVWPTTTVVIPAYNEEAGIAAVLQGLFAVVDDSYEVLVLDDGSDDNTRKVASSFPCRVVSHDMRRGKGEAMRTAIGVAKGRNVIFTDADGSYPVEIIPEIGRALEKYDMVVASRVAGKQNVPAFNRIGNAIFRQSIRYLYGFGPYDPLTGLYGVNKVHLLSMDLSSSGFGIESEIAIKGARMGLRMFDIPIEYRARIGQAKLHGLKDGFRIFLTIVSFLPRYRPWLCVALAGLLLLSAGGILTLLSQLAASKRSSLA
jgi:glycosyltransferase involved in cell wall biosynthesis